MLSEDYPVTNHISKDSGTRNDKKPHLTQISDLLIVKHVSCCFIFCFYRNILKQKDRNPSSQCELSVTCIKNADGIRKTEENIGKWHVWKMKYSLWQRITWVSSRHSEVYNFILILLNTNLFKIMLMTSKWLNASGLSGERSDIPNFSWRIFSVNF